MKLQFGAVLFGLLALSAPAHAVTVDVNSGSSAGAIVGLAAGTYTVTYSTTGAYQAWNPWQTSDGVKGCALGGTNCTNGYLDAFAIDFGFGGVTFNGVDGYQFGFVSTPGNSGMYATPAQSLAAYMTLPLSYAPLPQVADPNAYSLVGGPFTFTLAAAQNVRFFIYDSNYGDNGITVGVSLDVAAAVAPPSGIPEASTWILMLLGFGGLGMAGWRSSRRRPAAI